MRFRATIELGGKTATGIRVPAEVIESLGAGKRPPVSVTIKGHTYRSTIAVMGGAYMLSVSSENRESAGVAAGDEVDIDIEVDHEPREVTVPADLADALACEEEAKRFFDGLSYTQQLLYVTWIESAKKAETRERRVTEAVAKLRDGKNLR